MYSFYTIIWSTFFDDEGFAGLVKDKRWLNLSDDKKKYKHIQEKLVNSQGYKADQKMLGGLALGLNPNPSERPTVEQAIEFLEGLSEKDVFG